MADPIAVYDRLRNDPVIKAAVLDGAQDRGHGDMISPLWGLMYHHTGASGWSSPWSIANHPSLGLCSQFFLDRAGKLTICGYGIAWHGGAGSGYDIRDVNAQLIGMEMDNNGTEGWGSAQYWAAVRIGALTFDTSKLGNDRALGHKDWAGAAQGKWDPGGMNMAKLKSDVGVVRGELGVAAPVVIENQINRVRGFSPWLGDALTDELPLRGRVAGKVRRYQGGNIMWREDRNATIPVPSAVLEIYERFDFENGPAGFPDRFHTVVPLKNTAGELVLDGNGNTIPIGDVQGFSNGWVALRKYATAGFMVHGQIGDRYAREGWQYGSLGWPISDEYERDGIIVQDFENGQLLCDRNGTVKVDRGDYLYIPPGR